MSVVIVNSQVKPIVECPATLFIPVDKGQFAKHEFTVVFVRQRKDARDALQKRYIDGAITMSQLLDEVVSGWGGMLDANGQPVPYSHAERAEANQEWIGLEEAMVVSWFDHLFVHQREAAVKNSAAPSSTTLGSTAPGATS